MPSDPPPQATANSKGGQIITNDDSDDSFDMSDEEAATELVDLANAAEQSAPEHRPRDWKQNMRDVEEFEDYGGALFDEAERMLLGKNAMQPIVLQVLTVHREDQA